jgi:4-hydroxythreonine-4-phosphate dehydrogenase
MYSESYSVVLVTTHLSLAGAAASIDENSIVSAAKAGYQAVSSIKGINAKIAVAGLDPHCGDEGAIGDFDMKVTSRAVNALRDDGIAVDGPVPADSLFIPDRWELYDLAVAMYHDQGLIPFKMLSFDNGVNITLGLPLVRTSPDHGTAFDIAGRGIARYESMKAAIELAVRLAENNKANESD